MWRRTRQAEGTRRSTRYRLDTQLTQDCLVLSIDWTKYHIYCPLLSLLSSYHKLEFLQILRKAAPYMGTQSFSTLLFKCWKGFLSFFFHCILAFHSVQFCCIYNHYVLCFGRMHFVIKAFHTTRGMISLTINISAQPVPPPPREYLK